MDMETENGNGHHKGVDNGNGHKKTPGDSENGYIHIGEETIHEHTTESTMYLHTGNIANWSNLKSRKSSDIPAHELHQSFARTLEKRVKENGPLCNKEAYSQCNDAAVLDDNERGLLKVTVKIFLQKFRVECVREAVDLTLSQLGLRHIDSVYLSLPPLPTTSSFEELILPFWEQMERLRDAGLAIQISSCDLDREKLETLMKVVRVKPEVNQVNLASCCHMPEELVKFAKEVGIVLHTHGDQPIMLSDDTLKDIIKRLDPSDPRTFNCDWLVRYAVIVKCRGVIQNKGYIVSFKALQVNKKPVDVPPGKMMLQQDGLMGGCLL